MIFVIGLKKIRYALFYKDHLPLSVSSLVSLSLVIGQLSKGGLPYSSVNEAKFDSIEVVSVLPQNNRALKSVYAPAPVSPSKNEALKFAHPLPLKAAHIYELFVSCLLPDN